MTSNTCIDFIQFKDLTLHVNSREQLKTFPSCITLHHIWLVSGGSRISPKRGRQLPKVLLFCNFFCQKLHENERIWTPGGGARPWRPLRSANASVIKNADSNVGDKITSQKTLFSTNLTISNNHTCFARTQKRWNL